MADQISQKVIAELDHLSIQLGQTLLSLKNKEKESLNKILSYLPADLNLFFLQATAENGRLGLLGELKNSQKNQLPDAFMKVFLFERLFSTVSQIKSLFPGNMEKKS